MAGKPRNNITAMTDHSFARLGWQTHDRDERILTWAKACLPVARKAVADPANAQWLRCGGTWFAGVRLLETDADGGVDGRTRLAGAAVDHCRAAMSPGGWDWGPVQVSICYPGYPRPMEGESEAGFRYRQRRDAAHVDGLLPEGANRRRHLREVHGVLLGIPLTQSDHGASPFVVWEGSHDIMRRAFADAFHNIDPRDWGDVDVTEIYHAARREAFETCRRVEITARPGEAYVVHRLALHGVAPWHDGAPAGPDGRMIAYLRPELPETGDWLALP